MSENIITIEQNKPPSRIHQLANGMKMKSDSELETWRAETLFSKEPETIEWIDHYGATESVFFDIGANIGSYSLYAAFSNAKLKVYSFEPVADNYVSLLRNRLINKLENINPFQVALSSRDGIETIFISDERIGNSGAQISSPVNEHGKIFQPCSKNILLCFALDTLVNNYNMPIPGFIKIDVDGVEMEILKGATSLLGHPGLKSVLIESNGDKQKVRIETLLADKGFHPDERFNSLPNHSSHRRREKVDNVAVNIVYSRSR